MQWVPLVHEFFVTHNVTSSVCIHFERTKHDFRISMFQMLQFEERRREKRPPLAVWPCFDGRAPGIGRRKKRLLSFVYFRHCQRRCLHSDIFERLLPCQVCRTSVAHILAAALAVKPKYEIWLNPNATQQWIQYGLSDFLDAWSQIDFFMYKSMGNVLVRFKLTCLNYVINMNKKWVYLSSF